MMFSLVSETSKNKMHDIKRLYKVSLQVSWFTFCFFKLVFKLSLSGYTLHPEITRFNISISTAEQSLCLKSVLLTKPFHVLSSCLTTMSTTSQ